MKKLFSSLALLPFILNAMDCPSCKQTLPKPALQIKSNDYSVTHRRDLQIFFNNRKIGDIAYELSLHRDSPHANGELIGLNAHEITHAKKYGRLILATALHSIYLQAPADLSKLANKPSEINLVLFHANIANNHFSTQNIYASLGFLKEEEKDIYAVYRHGFDRYTFPSLVEMKRKYEETILGLEQSKL